MGMREERNPLQIRRIDSGQVLDLLRAGKTNVDIARQLGCSREYIRQRRNKFETQGLLSREIIPHRVGRARAAVTAKQLKVGKARLSVKTNVGT